MAKTALHPSSGDGSNIVGALAKHSSSTSAVGGSTRRHVAARKTGGDTLLRCRQNAYFYLVEAVVSALSADSIIRSKPPSKRLVGTLASSHTENPHGNTLTDTYFRGKGKTCTVNENKTTLNTKTRGKYLYKVEPQGRRCDDRVCICQGYHLHSQGAEVCSSSKANKQRI